MARDMVWHELYDRMQDDRCPICEMIHDRVQRGMEGFLYESVNDPVLRDHFRNSNGLCNYHAYMLMDIGDPLAHALIYNELVKRSVQHMRMPPIKRQAGVYQSHPNCYFCQQAEEGESTYIKAFASSFGDDEFSARYISGGLLCIPHLELLKIGGGHKNAEQIIEATLQKYQAVIHQLSEIVRKNDYRFSSEPWPKQERTAWKRAVFIINACKGIRK